MRTSRLLTFGSAASLCIAGYLLTNLIAQQDAQVKIRPTDIGGVVASSKGPEAGVCVIAETTSLPTRYIKEVVTDDRGRYLIPDLLRLRALLALAFPDSGRGERPLAEGAPFKGPPCGMAAYSS